jgi:hypothetical protein
MYIRNHRFSVCNRCLGIGNHRFSICNRCLGIGNHRLGIRDPHVGVDRKLSLKGASLSSQIPNKSQLNVR